MKRKLVTLSTVVTLVAVALLVRNKLPRDGKAIRGEVVETYCFTTGNETGAAHASCGILCAKRGIPIAVHDASSSKTYILLPSRDKAPLPEGLIAAMGKQVTIQGDVIQRGSSTFLTVKSFAVE
jgi:hypothetical protein